MTAANHHRTDRGLDRFARRMTLVQRTPTTSATSSALRRTDGPPRQESSEPWDTMLTRLAIDQVRDRLEDVVGSLEHLPSTTPPLDAALRHVRSALRELELS